MKVFIIVFLINSFLAGAVFGNMKSKGVDHKVALNRALEIFVMGIFLLAEYVRSLKDDE